MTAPENTASSRLVARLGAVREGEVDGAQVWVHRPVARTRISARVETEARRDEDATKMLKRGA